MPDRFATTIAERPSRLQAWMLAARPLTLSLSIAPVAVGACLAWGETGRARPVTVAAAALAAVLIQIGANLYNDAADHLGGADGPGRLGPPRMTAQGLLDATEVACAALAAFGLAAALGVGLIWVGGWPILGIGVLSLVCGLGYSGGPYPISHSPFGELFVILFFGVAAVGGTYWLAAGEYGAAPATAGVAIGLFAAAALTVNNHRDREEDTRAGRYTLAIALGPSATRAVYAALMLAPFGLLLLVGRLAPIPHVQLAFAALPVAAALVLRFAREPPGRGFNAILARTAQTQALFAALLSVGAIW